VLLTPFHRNGTLETALKREFIADPLPDWPTKKTIVAIGMAFGMEALHGMGFAHRDVKAANILLDENFEPVIADLGLVTNLDLEPGDRAAPSMAIGTPLHMAPELWTDDSPGYTSAVDVYAYGVLLYSLFVKDPHNMLDDDGGPARSPQMLMMRIERGTRFRRDPARIGDAYWELITDCWAPAPETRPSFAQIVDHMAQNIAAFLLPGANAADVQAYIEKMRARRPAGGR
jgi:serine/threonine protein kinase